jgi:hypothetical protein
LAALFLLLQDDEDEDGEDENTEAIQALLGSSAIVFSSRAEKWTDVRINFAEHVSRLRHRNKFQRMYRMSYNAFLYLVEILTPLLEAEGHHYWKSGAHRIFPEIIVAVGLRWLAAEVTSIYRSHFGSARRRCTDVPSSSLKLYWLVRSFKLSSL